MSHNGNFDRLVASQELFVGWRTHRACALSNTDRSLVACRSFFERDVPIIVVLLGPPVAPIDTVQMKPGFMMATLISRSQAECSSWDGECTMLMHFPKSMRIRWFEKSADVCPHVRNGSRSPQWCAAWWRRQGTISKCFVNSIDVVSAAASPRSTIEVTCNPSQPVEKS